MPQPLIIEVEIRPLRALRFAHPTARQQLRQKKGFLLGQFFREAF
jgi:hypothetical protein